MKEKIDLDAHNEALVTRLIAGDAEARDELIVFNQRIVYVTVDRTLRLWTNFRHLYNDLVGVGMLALVQAVDRLTEIGEAARPIQNYLITSIRNALVSDLIKPEGGCGQVAHYQTIHYVDSYHRVPEHVLAKTDPAFARIEDHEFLLSLCDIEREREILTYYLAGKKPVDIIRATEYSMNVVHKTLQLFREKLKESQESLSG